MQKMISLFKRDFGNKECFAYDEYEDSTEWVVNGEGIATRKFDGTACLIKDGVFYKRLKAKNPINRFLHWSFDKEQKTGHGWFPVQDVSSDQIHLSIPDIASRSDGTYELCGEKVNKNPEKISGHMLIEHGEIVYANAPTEFNKLKEFLEDRDVEGIVWHHPDGRMVKIKKSDFGLRR